MSTEPTWTAIAIATEDDLEDFISDVPDRAFVLYGGHEWIAVFGEYGEFWLRALDEEEYQAASKAGGPNAKWMHADDATPPFTYLVERAPAPTATTIPAGEPETCNCGADGCDCPARDCDCVTIPLNRPAGQRVSLTAGELRAEHVGRQIDLGDGEWVLLENINHSRDQVVVRTSDYPNCMRWLPHDTLVTLLPEGGER